MLAEIVSYEPQHQQNVEAFFRAVWHGSRFPFNPTGAHADLRRIPTEYQIGGGGFWLMLLSDEIVGTVAVRRLSGNVAEIKRLNVVQSQRGRGFGERLLQHAFAHAMGSGYRTIRLDTIRMPGPALHLFKKVGFKEIPRYNTNPDADCFMERDLEPPSTPSHPLNE